MFKNDVQSLSELHRYCRCCRTSISLTVARHPLASILGTSLKLPSNSPRLARSSDNGSRSSKQASSYQTDSKIIELLHSTTIIHPNIDFERLKLNVDLSEQYGETKLVTAL